MDLQELFRRCSGKYAFEDLGHFPKGSQMQQLYHDVYTRLSVYFAGGPDADSKIEYQGQNYRYADFFDYKPYGLTFAEACHAMIALFEDCPLAYFVNTYQVFGNPEKGLVLFALADEYGSGAERRKTSAKIEAELSRLLSLVPPGLTDAKKARRVYDLLCDFAEYDRAASVRTYVDIPAHAVSGVFCKRKAVCEGLSKAYQSMMLFLHVACLTVQGIYQTARGENAGNTPDRNRHAWNLVKIGEHWKIVDITRGLAGGDGFFVSGPHAQYCSLSASEKNTHAYLYQFSTPEWT